MWIVHRIIRAGYSSLHATGILSTSVGRSAYEFLYEKYKLQGEMAAIQALCDGISPGTIVIDVGANIGIYTNAFSKKVGDDGRVLAIEPDPENVATLQKRFPSPSNVEVIEAAASDKLGIMYLARDEFNPAGHVLSDKGLAVRSVTLDDLVREIGLPVSVIKIDVEGAEPLVLQGARTAIERYHPTILLEYSPDRISKFMDCPFNLLKRFESLGYQFFIPKDLKPIAIEDIEEAAKPRGYIDILIKFPN